MTDTMGRKHSDTEFTGCLYVSAYVEMMGVIGIENTPWSGPRSRWSWLWKRLSNNFD
ncbi:GGGtGRT protein [Geomonas sp. Red69]|uniref:GGGtGRT protein n=1 Tax=Geomonas diazotrophica TaxID=2843197 RepID=A0ABX8JFV5_9BACT|nr:GGGtGRT protein [Geomonas diazotrophica]QWV96449.1 GGGtGRT protein [Geomonas nitrogeniifigens]